MKDPQEIYDEWMEGETSGVRPARVKVLREELSQYTGMPIPRRVPEIENWLDTMKGQVTRKLRAHQAVETGDETEEDEGTE